MRLPQIDGVAPSRVRLPDEVQGALGDFLCRFFPRLETEVWRQRLESGKVLNEAGLPLHWDSPCQAAALVFYYREPPPEIEVPFQEEILYQDDHLLIADKPHFLPVIPSGRFLRETLLIRLRRSTGIADLTPVHRLDRDTAGLVIFSVNPASRGRYNSLFQQRSIRKIYHAVAPWQEKLLEPLIHHSLMVESQPFFRMQEVPGEPNSSTRVSLLEHRGEHALYQLEPVSGRKHQLRVHMASLGAGIINDPYYPNMLPDVAHDDFSSPLQLLAYSLTFQDPISGEERRFTSKRRL
jgi:tRNA pseudouridine32 synthase / 23S rRNA pseudouridine746 synthase